MTIRPQSFEFPGAVRDAALGDLESFINAKLAALFQSHCAQGREQLAHVLIEWVEDFVCGTLSQSGYSFGRIDYGGDKNYEDSVQIFCDGDIMGSGIILTFTGFNCQVEWQDAQQIGIGRA